MVDGVFGQLLNESEAAACAGAVMQRLRLANDHAWLTARERGRLAVEQGGRLAVRRGAWLAALLPSAYLFFDTPSSWTSRRGEYSGVVQRHGTRGFADRAGCAHRADDLAALEARSDGDVVCARGQVRSLGSGGLAVYRQRFIALTITGLLRTVHHHVAVERARDFDIELAGGGWARVCAAESWLVGPVPSLEDGGIEDIASLWDLPESDTLLPAAAKVSRVAQASFDLEEGAAISVIGAKTRVALPGASERLPRQEPWHPALCAAAASPLLIRAGGLPGA